MLRTKLRGSCSKKLWPLIDFKHCHSAKSFHMARPQQGKLWAKLLPKVAFLESPLFFWMAIRLRVSIDRDAERLLNQLGEQGWELIFILASRYYLKRLKS